MKILYPKVSICLEHSAYRLVKVKAHARRINDKVVKVRSHYRCIEVRSGVSVRIS